MTTHATTLYESAGVNAVPDTEIGRIFNATHWAAAPLGPVSRWPQSLRTAISICLNSRFPMFVWWGPQLVNIYNDAYIPTLGKRHPSAFGRPARETWSDIWSVVGPQADMVMKGGRPTWNERVLLVTERNGFPEETYFTWSYSPIYDEGGSIGGLFCACMEETAYVAADAERARLVREAQDAASTLQTWFDNAPGFIALLRGPNFVIEMVNKAYYELLGHRPVEPAPWLEAVPEAREQGFEALLRGVYESGVPFVGRGVRFVVQRTPDAPAVECFLDFVYQPVRDAHGKVVGIFVQGHDVSEQVHAVEALRESDRRKDVFLATLAHELRNPLAPIRQAAALAKSPRVDFPRQQWALGVIERQARHMALLLDDLLDVSRISRGRLELRRQPTALLDIINSAVETVLPLVERKHHRLSVRLPPEPVMLWADPVRLAQVLSNLLSNAAKYTDESGEISVSATRDGAEVAICVRDNGIGISPESQAHVFQMFSQVSPALERAEGGLGIGLALSKGLVDLHEGRIEVYSAGLGKGTEFTVHLPLLQAAATGVPAPAQAAAGTAGGRSVLIVDDNLDALESLAILLEMQGFAVRAASDGLTALEMAAHSPPEVAVLDIGMPGLNGYELARRIRAAPWGSDILLIALTGWGQAADQARALEAGFDHHATKPVDPEHLQALIGRPRVRGQVATAIAAPTDTR